MATTNDQQQGFPDLESPIADKQGNLTPPWFRLLVTIWQRTGGGQENTTLPSLTVTGTTELQGNVILDESATINGSLDVQGELLSPFAYSHTTTDAANVVVTATGELLRSTAQNATVNIKKLWQILAHDGVSAFYSSPIYVPNFHSPTYTGPALVFQGYDWFVYVVNASNGANLTGWPQATSGPCYGRCQALDVNGDGFTEVFAATHGDQNGSPGEIIAFTSAGGLLWKKFNVYFAEAFNDAIFNATYNTLGGMTATGGATLSSTTTSLTANITNQNWPSNAFTRTQGLGFGARLLITAGTGVGQIREITSITGGVTFNLSAVWTTLPDATSLWQVLPRYTSDELYQHAGTLNQEAGIWYLYVTSDDNTLVKFNATTGAKVWRFWATENNEPYPLIQDVNNDGVPEILFNSVDGHCYCINTAGSIVWSFNSPTGCDSFLAAADVGNLGYPQVLVNERRSGNASGGRLAIISGITGALIAESTDQFGDMDSRPLVIPRNDGSGKSYVFIAGDAGYCTLLDDTCFGLWQDNRGDTNGLAGFNSSPQLADVNYDGVQEIVACNQQAAIMVYSQKGQRISTFTLPSRPAGTQVGIEGIPYIGDINGDGLLEFVVPSVDGYMTCYQFTH